MRSMMPGELIKALPPIGVAALRFNFRGMGASEGAFEDGVGEKLDTVAAIDTIHDVIEGLPIGLIGSSFGADTVLTVPDPRVTGWCALAPPLREHRLESMTSVADDQRPKLLVVAERDQFRPPSDAEAIVEHWTNTRLDVVVGADHFFVGRVDRVVEHCIDFVKSLRTDLQRTSDRPGTSSPDDRTAS